MNSRTLVLVAFTAAAAVGARAALPVCATFTGERSEHTWTLEQLTPELHGDWPQKASSFEELRRAWAAADETLKAAQPDRYRYGGFASPRAKASGFFRLEQVDGRWWFVCPDGHLFFSTGLNGVGTASGTRVQGRVDLFAALPPPHLTLRGWIRWRCCGKTEVVGFR